MNFNDDFFDRLDRDFEKSAKRGALAVIGVWLFMALFGVAVWGGLIYFVFWLLNHYGVI